MGRHLKLVSSFILAVFLLGQDAEVTVKLRKLFGSLTSDEAIQNNILGSIGRMVELAEEKLRTYQTLNRLLDGINNDILKELYQENTESQAQIPSAEDIRKNIEDHLRKMIEMAEGVLQTYIELSDVLPGISEDNLRQYYQEYQADMLLNSKADKGRRIDVIGIFATVAVSVALLGF